MEEEFSSWIRRTKFSHTVCHRVNSFGLASLPLTIDEERISRLGALPGRDSSSSNQSGKSSASVGSQVRSSPVRFSTKKSASFATQDEKSPVQSGMKKSASFASVPLSIDEERTSRLGGSLPGRDSFSSNQTAKNSTSVASRFQNSPVRSSMKKSASFATQDEKSPVCSSVKKSASFASIPVSVDEERISRLGGLLSGRDSSSSNQTAKNSTSVASRFRNSPVRSSMKKLTSFASEDQKSPVCSSVKKSASFASIPVSVDEERISQLGGSLSGRDSSSNQTARNSTSVASRFQNSPVRSSTKKSASFASQVQNSPVRSSTKKSASFAGHDQESPVGSNTQIQRNPGMNKQRSMSPLPTTELSDTFREARSERKRFSTPLRGRVSSRDTSPLKLFSRDTSPFKGKLFDRDTSPLRHLTSWKGREKSKIKKECSWIKYFDNGGGKINAVGAADEFTIDMSQLFLGLRFAHGAHSRLYHGVYKDETVAVKMIRVPDDDETGTLAVRLGNQYEREVTLLSRLHHPNVIKFVAACRKPPVYCIITEYLSEGSLRAYLHKLEHKVLPLQKLIAMALDIARGLEYIHSEGVIHRDLKPENILINKDFQMKLADFGIACEEAYCDSLADDPGTYRWMAPEMIKKKPYGRKVDVYSFGLILWEMVAGTIPYEDMNPIQAAFAVVNKNLRPVVPVTCPPALRALIEQCWSLQPEKRPEFWQIVMVLEQFESSLASDGTLTLVQNPLCQDHKKGLLHWIQKLTPAHPVSPTPKPKFL